MRYITDDFVSMFSTGGRFGRGVSKEGGGGVVRNYLKCCLLEILEAPDCNNSVRFFSSTVPLVVLLLSAYLPLKKKLCSWKT